jgi:hypothetical protein
MALRPQRARANAASTSSSVRQFQASVLPRNVFLLGGVRGQLRGGGELLPIPQRQHNAAGVDEGDLVAG